MKLEFVELAGFRGFRDKTRFDLPGGFTVISGRNGVGKSTILDAVDFAITGTINKYSVTNARGGGLENHIWWVGDDSASEQFVSVGFVDDAGNRFVVTRDRNKTSKSTAGEILDRLCLAGSKAPATCDALMKTTLIRDELISALSLDLPEQARFSAVQTAIGAISGPDHSQRTAAILKEAQSSLKAEEVRSHEIQKQLGRALEHLTEVRTEAERSGDLAAALQVVDNIVPVVMGEPRLETVRSFIAEGKINLSNFNDARNRALELTSEVAVVTSSSYQDEIQEAETKLREAVSNTAVSLGKLTRAEEFDEVERSSDLDEAHLAALLEHGDALGLQEGHCPLCDAARSDPEFSAALEAIRSRLSDRAKRLASTADGPRSAQIEFKQNQKDETSARDSLNEITARSQLLEKFQSGLRQEYVAAGFSEISIEDLNAAEQASRDAHQRLVELERAALILGASDAAERITALEKKIVEFRNDAEVMAGKVAFAEKVVESSRQIDHASKAVSTEILKEQFDTVMPLLKELYRRLRPHTNWAEIGTDFGGAVRGSLNFTVGNGYNPQFLFSSGQRRAAGLAFLLSVHLSRQWCCWHTLLLDDPVQHIDDYRALHLVEVLAALRLSGRQIIVAVEDEALADLLCRRLRSTTTQPGRRYDLGGSSNGTARLNTTLEILPMSQSVLKLAEAS